LKLALLRKSGPARAWKSRRRRRGTLACGSPPHRFDEHLPKSGVVKVHAYAQARVPKLRLAPAPRTIGRVNEHDRPRPRDIIIDVAHGAAGWSVSPGKPKFARRAAGERPAHAHAFAATALDIVTGADINLD
jgi:hypothetical protein